MAPTRRTLLQASALGLAGSVAGCAGASENRQGTEATTGGGATTTREPDETILFGGEASHWFGLAPKSIHGAENPTLVMEPGTVYEVVWVNIDGVEHEFRIFDDQNEQVVATESAEEVGATRSLVVEATESFDHYACEYHPKSMHGQITQGGGTTSAQSGGATTTESGGGTTQGGGQY